MKILETNFEGLMLMEFNTFNDKRGLFYESWRYNDYKDIGIADDFVQDNISISKKNVLRGLHGQENQGQLVYVTHGEILDVVVDLRPHSKTYKKYFSVILSANQPRQLYVPPGFVHGFCVLSDFAIINYKCSQYYNPSKEVGVLWSSAGIAWPDENFIINERDRGFRELQ